MGLDVDDGTDIFLYAYPETGYISPWGYWSQGITVDIVGVLVEPDLGSTIHRCL